MKIGTLEILNLTPHTVRVMDEHGEVLGEFPVAGKPAWVKSNSIVDFTIEGIPFARTFFGDVEHMPPYNAAGNRRYIVSSVVLSAVQATSRPTDDLLVPVGLVRDNAGAVIGCKALSLG